jgi:hypothetical protein
MFRVTYPLISMDGSRTFATREEAEAFARKARDTHSYQTMHSWRQIQVHEIEESES